MAKDKDSIILYQKQTDKCRKYMTDEQFGRLIAALLDFARGKQPNVDDDIALAFDFMALQEEINRNNYERRCEINRENARKGGAPKGNQNARKQPKQPKQPNAKKNNPKRREEKISEEKISDDKIQHDFFTFGTFENVELTETERDVLAQTYERSEELIDKVSVWLRGATNDVPDHYGLCIKFANNDSWPKRKVIEPVEMYEPEDPLTEEEQDLKVAEMRARLNEAIPAG